MCSEDSTSREGKPFLNFFRTTKFDMSTSTKGSISKNNGHSENVGVEKIIPEKNEVVLRNGRTIGYDYLVLATGQKENFESIKGF